MGLLLNENSSHENCHLQFFARSHSGFHSLTEIRITL